MPQPGGWLVFCRSRVEACRRLALASPDPGVRTEFARLADEWAASAGIDPVESARLKAERQLSREH